MNIFTRDMNFVKFNNVEMEWVKFNGNLVYESWKTLTTQGIPPLTINNCKNTNMLGYKVYGESKQQILPDGYTQLEYIESTGTQYIDTGINPDRTSRFELSFIQTTHNTSIMGAYSSNNNRVQAFRGGVSGNDSSYFEFRVFCNTDHKDYDPNVLYSSDTKLNVVFDIKNLKGTVNGDVVNLTDMEGGDISYPIWLFCANNAGSIATISNSKLYSYEHYKNDNLIQKLVPCKNSSNVVGMYDIVNGVFYQNAGTGTFTAGPVAPTPNAPIEIESVGNKTANLLKTYGRTQGYPSNTAESEATQRTYDYNTYIVGLGYNNKYAPQGINSYSITEDKVTVNVNAATYGIGFPMEVKPSTTYTFSYSDISNVYPRMVFYDASGTVKRFINLNDNTNYTTNADEVCGVFLLNASSYNTDCWIEKPQWERGSTKTTFDYYGYKVPIKVSGQNVINMADTAFDFDEPVSMWAYTLFNNTKTKKYLKPNTTYTISYNLECTSVPEHTEGFDNRYGFFLYSGVSGYSSIILYQYGYLSVGDTSSYIYTFTTPANLYDDNANYRILGYTNLYKNGDATASASMQFSNIQIVEGSYTAQTMPKYEPYFAPTTTNIYLNEPLRKIGNANAVKLPDGYTQLEYIQSTGSQVINTGFNVNINNASLVRFVVDEVITSNSIWNLNGSADNGFNAVYVGRHNDEFQYGVGNDRGTGITTSDASKRYVYDLDVKNDIYKVLDYEANTYVVNLSSLTKNLNNFDTTGLPLWIMGYSGESRKHNSKLYGAKIYLNDILQHEYIPAKNSSNVLGLYDIVTNTFLTNAGTGTFTAGNEIYSDYIDFETQKVYRNVGHIDLGKPTYTYQSQYTRFRSDTISGIKIVTGNWTYDLKSDIYGTTLAQNFNIGAQGGSLFVWDNRYTDPADLETALTGHYLDFALGTTTETSITLPDILLNKGTNIVEVDTSIAPSNMWIKYKGKN